MKKVYWSLIFSFLTIHLFAQATPSSIQAVKVFRQNAEVTRNARITLAPGTQEIVLTGISTNINASSVQVKIDQPGVTLLSVKYKVNYLQTTEISAEEKKIRQQITEAKGQVTWIKEQRAVLKGVEDILNKNQALGGRNEAFSAAQVLELVNMYKTKYLEFKKEDNVLKAQEDKLNKEIAKLQRQVGELRSNHNKPSGNIVLKLAAKRNVTTQVTCTYTVSNAGWSPLYDLRSEGITSDVQLFYKANIYQSTGVAWKDVSVTVSSGNPAQNQNRPILSPLYANFSTPYPMNARKKRLARPEAKATNMALDEIAEEKDGFSYDANVVTNQTTIEFELPDRQTIMADGKENLVSLESYDLETKYVYHTVPKINKSAFLIAKVKNWGQYNLESGEANVFFDGGFVGNTTIDANVSSEELLISMGLDNGIVVERKPVTEFASKKLLGTKKKETFAFDIVVRNKKSIAIDIEVLDQIPVSQNDQISVELEEKGSADYNEEIGKLLWNFRINPGQAKKERFIYSVKYPKGKQVYGKR